MTVKEPKDLAGLDQSEIDLKVRSLIMGLHCITASLCKYYFKKCTTPCCCILKSFHTCVYAVTVSLADMSSLLAVPRVSVLYVAECPKLS